MASGETLSSRGIQPSRETRSGGFDLIRVAAALGVVGLHATTPYLRHPMPGLAWPVNDTPSLLADWIGWSIEIVIMPVFLAVAGYFAVPSFHRLGMRSFIRSRWSRLIVPLLVAGPLILTSDLYVWLTGWVVEGHIGIEKLRSLKFANEVDTGLWGLSHLWFLPYCFLYSLSLALCFFGFSKFQARAQREPRPSVEHTFLTLPHAPALLVACGLVAAFVLCFRPNIVFGFQHDFLPVPSKWFYSGTYFAGGALIASSPNTLAMLQRHCGKLLMIGGLAIPIAVVCGWKWIETLTFTELPARTIANISANGYRLQPLVALTTTFAAWTIVLGVIGWGASSQKRCTPVLNHMAAASFWIYLFHHPVVGLSHVQLKTLFPSMAPELKILFSFLAGIVISSLLFVVLGRTGRIARLLGTSTSNAAAHTKTENQQPQSLDPLDPSQSITHSPANPTTRRIAA